MINKLNILNKHLAFLYELKSDILMNLELNKNLDFPIKENEDDLNRCMVDTDNKISALQSELFRLNV